MTLVSGRWQRLLAQPVAELAVIVIGVTIALWADDWVSNRAEQAEETARLEALLDNVRDTLANLNESQDRIRGGAEALKKLLLDDIRELPSDEQNATLRYGMLFGTTFAPELSVYDDLENSGELGLLSNKELRNNLAILNARLESTRMVQSDLGSVQQLTIDSYLVDNLDLTPLYAGWLEFDLLSATTAGESEFLKSRTFRNIVMLKLDIVQNLLRSLDEVEETLLDIERIVSAQLE